MATTRLSRTIRAPRDVIYRALIDPAAVQRWMVPDGMTSHVHAFDAREGATFRISLTYEDPAADGKTSAHTDTFHGTFVELVPCSRVVQVIDVTLMAGPPDVGDRVGDRCGDGDGDP